MLVFPESVLVGYILKALGVVHFSHCSRGSIVIKFVCKFSGGSSKLENRSLKFPSWEPFHTLLWLLLHFVLLLLWFGLYTEKSLSHG